jgi:hypothetical protein
MNHTLKRGRIMLTKIKTAVAVALLASFASAALAHPRALQIKPDPAIKACVTDEGQGRTRPCDSGGA